ncbi:MAG: peptidylprolyl isomerase [Bauldia sp.]|nr:peptidylprolyl isomerase [Bauldia sp.]
MKILISLMFGALMVLGSAGQPAFAQTTIKIIVNGLPITSYDINQRVRILRISGGSATTQNAQRELIDEAVQIAEARRRGISVSESQVENAFATIARGINMSAAQLTSALSGEGIAASSLKSRIRAQIAWSLLVQQRLAREGVRNDDIVAALFAEGNQAALTTTEYVLQQIIFVVPSGSSSSFTQQRRREAENYRLRYSGCATAIQQASALRDVVVRDIGRRMASELSGAQGQAVTSTAIGSATRPVQTENGFELIGVCDKRDIQSTADARTAVENRLTLAKGQEVGQEYLAELRAAAIIQYL